MSWERAEEANLGAVGIGNAMLKSMVTDPDRRVAEWLFSELDRLVGSQLPPENETLRLYCAISLRLVALLAQFGAQTVREAKEQGATLSEDPATFQSPYDSLLELADLEVAFTTQDQIDACRGVLVDDATEGGPGDPPSS